MNPPLKNRKPEKPIGQVCPSLQHYASAPRTGRGSSRSSGSSGSLGIRFFRGSTQTCNSKACSSLEDSLQCLDQLEIRPSCSDHCNARDHGTPHGPFRRRGGCGSGHFRGDSLSPQEVVLSCVLCDVALPFLISKPQPNLFAMPELTRHERGLAQMFYRIVSASVELAYPVLDEVRCREVCQESLRGWGGEQSLRTRPTRNRPNRAGCVDGSPAEQDTCGRQRARNRPSGWAGELVNW
jgi:hypothetical protein